MVLRQCSFRGSNLGSNAVRLRPSTGVQVVFQEAQVIDSRQGETQETSIVSIRNQQVAGSGMPKRWHIILQPIKFRPPFRLRSSSHSDILLVSPPFGREISRDPALGGAGLRGWPDWE